MTKLTAPTEATVEDWRDIAARNLEAAVAERRLKLDAIAENERLREALNRIAAHYTDTELAAKHMAAIARAALRSITAEPGEMK